MVSIFSFSFFFLVMISLAPHLKLSPRIPLSSPSSWHTKNSEAARALRSCGPDSTQANRLQCGHHQDDQLNPRLWASQSFTWFSETTNGALGMRIKNPVQSPSEECLENRWALLGSGSVSESSFSRYINGYIFPSNCCTGGRSQRDDANELAVQNKFKNSARY